MSRSAFIALIPLALVLAGCGRRDVTGTWELLDPTTKIALGDVITLEKGGKWHRTGFPPMEGAYEWEDDKLRFTIQKVGELTREEAVKSAKGLVDVEAQIKKLEAQHVFELSEEDGRTFLKQSGDVPGFGVLLLRKKKE